MKIVYDKGGIFPKQFGNFHLALLEKEEGDLESALRDAEAKVFLQVAIVEMVLSSFGALPGFLIDMMGGAIFRNNTYQLFLLETVVKDVKNTGLRKLWQGEKSTPIVAYCGQNITPFKYANVSKPEHYADMVAGRMDEILDFRDSFTLRTYEEKGKNATDFYMKRALDSLKSVRPELVVEIPPANPPF